MLVFRARFSVVYLNFEVTCTNNVCLLFCLFAFFIKLYLVEWCLFLADSSMYHVDDNQMSLPLLPSFTPPEIPKRTRIRRTIYLFFAIFNVSRSF